MANRSSPKVPPMIESEIEELVNQLMRDDVAESLARTLDVIESPIPSPAYEGLPHHGQESTSLTTESPADVNTHASVHELLGS